MRGGDRFRHRRGDRGDLVVAALDGVQDLASPCARLRPGLVRAPDFRIEVPAEVGKPLRVPGLPGQGGRGDDLARGPLVADCGQVDETRDDVGHLDAGVVQVVLHLDLEAEELQGAHEHVPQNGVAQVPDVGRLVGVDVGVLDDHLAVPR